jgi:hypothetical protein
MVAAMEVSGDALDGLHTPEKVWFEINDEGDSCDALVCMDDGTVYTALFVTFEYLQRQLELNFQMTQQMSEAPDVPYYVLDTPHILVPELTRESIEDTIDALMVQDVFESHFTRVTEKETDNTPKPPRTIGDGRRATQEVAAVVISDVLMVED